MSPPVEINLSEGLLQHWHTAKGYVDQSVNSLTDSAQKLGQSLQETTNTNTDKAIDVVTKTLGQSWQTAEQIKSTTSVALKTAIDASVNDWLVQHPTFWRLVQILGWATNHPIISFIILLFAIAVIWNIIKAIMYLIETASWSILQLPLKLIQALIQGVVLAVTKIVSLGIQKISNSHIMDDTKALPVTSTEVFAQYKQQRLIDISHRLEEIQQEQQQLLQEAQELIASDTIEVKLPEIKLTPSQN
ncbi:conserved hypothetical protein [Trichormus variabilis ATCC 29413]|uniref:Uncharacterized protein n=2 Tax=Anabaena variabilis TaxID=264691 RepID=Q3MH85_TRIV2|nr:MULTISPECIES: hypothetical protein [Nostocaceae]ABA19651.1 conserved hypothetical protein [Trichormus variabilis ATCC 29413]MBC1215511.1 hypothetical protein [Trichormus variabilis ARAD]MBC1254478.1 hypothetical protein [Trichormus variabilis V5]MBC1265946.1 hypothetical protein [Trichormus variabilis FSR]MBC1302220.1 hypothetical protein [Trichormus variabilis N2B]